MKDQTSKPSAVQASGKATTKKEEKAPKTIEVKKEKPREESKRQEKKETKEVKEEVKKLPPIDPQIIKAKKEALGLSMFISSVFKVALTEEDLPKLVGEREEYSLLKDLLSEKTRANEPVLFKKEDIDYILTAKLKMLNSVSFPRV